LSHSAHGVSQLLRALSYFLRRPLSSRYAADRAGEDGQHAAAVAEGGRRLRFAPPVTGRASNSANHESTGWVATPRRLERV
jgi:hypothetical protein